MTNLQNALIKYRKEHNLNQTELANIIGVTRSAIANWETGRSTPKSEFYITIAEKLDIDITFLLGSTSVDSNKINQHFELHGLEKDLSEEDKETIMNFAKFLVDKNKKSGQ